ncbi:hypothetical protein FDG2_1897 [Candidatus Protofrankia californiensis]|uniref:Nudix hydrolase domain-containing protein n=1 Tax=Candidatus Protofrankia californiensis TaxID=1839754 RepID=A0A1C3NWH3_9ACTN|nr:hypothetical protein FDG2_1897 [Candidatus Protofrankia californiensis]
MIKLSAVRDLALTAGAVALAALAADDVLGLPVRPERRTSGELPATAHGWLFQADPLGADRARRLRPATAAEAAASTTSRIAGNGGWFGLSRTGDLVDVDDVRFARAGREFGPDAIDPVFVPETTTATAVPPTVMPATADDAGQTRETVRLTADVVLFAMRDSEQHVLLIRRDWPPYEGYWALPGGHVDPGEQVEDAARRELAEETGIQAGPLHQVGVYNDPGRDPRGRYVTWAYTAVLPSLSQPTAGDDAGDARWIPLANALADGRLAFDHERILADALAVIEAVDA